MNKLAFLLCASLAFFHLGKSADAVEFPAKTITIICPYGAGGGTDVILRALSDSAAKIGGRNVIVQNLTGGNGALGVVNMMAASPDGYTIGSCSGEWVSLKELNLAPPTYDYNNAERIMHYNFDPAAFIIATESPFQTLEDLLEAARANPEGIVMGVTAAGGAHHLTTLLFQERSGVKFNILPYSEGASGVMAALMGEHIEVGCVGPAEAAAQVEAGQARLLAIASEKRMKAHPTVPTFLEKNFDVVYGSWRALAAPKGTPEPVIAKLEEIFYQAAQTPAFVEFCDRNGFTIDLLNRQEFEVRFKSQENLIKEVCEIYLRK